MPNLGDFVGQSTSTTSTGAITLDGTLAGYALFSSIGDGQLYYTIADGTSRETGIGTLTGVVLERTTVLMTLVAGAANTVDPTPINLSGNAQVFCALSKKAYEDLTAAPSVEGLAIDGSNSMLAPISFDGDVVIRKSAGSQNVIQSYSGGTDIYMDSSLLLRLDLAQGGTLLFDLAGFEIMRVTGPSGIRVMNGHDILLMSGSDIVLTDGQVKQPNAPIDPEDLVNLEFINGLSSGLALDGSNFMGADLRLSETEALNVHPSIKSLSMLDTDASGVPTGLYHFQIGGGILAVNGVDPMDSLLEFSTGGSQLQSQLQVFNLTSGDLEFVLTESDASAMLKLDASNWPDEFLRFSENWSAYDSSGQLMLYPSNPATGSPAGAAAIRYDAAVGSNVASLQLQADMSGPYLIADTHGTGSLGQLQLKQPTGLTYFDVRPSYAQFTYSSGTPALRYNSTQFQYFHTSGFPNLTASDVLFAYTQSGGSSSGFVYELGRFYVRDEFGNITLDSDVDYQAVAESYANGLKGQLNVYSTAGRPSPAIGLSVYDGDLSIPIYGDGSDWRNALGVLV